MSALNDDLIAQLLKEEAANPTTSTGGTRTRGPKVDLTEQREINIWMKLNHHMCLSDCEHRVASDGVVRAIACTNPDCIDTRDPDDRGRNIVALVKGQYVCRYCFLGRYLKDAE